MIRVSCWEQRLWAAIDAARDLPFAWGHHDCATWAFDLRRDLTGGEDVAAQWRGRYSTPLGARRIMRKLGWQDIEAMGRDLLGAPLATPLLAQRGDLVLGGEERAFGVCTGARAAFVSPDGLVQLPLARCALAWRV
jgi:hypothetical protein